MDRETKTEMVVPARPRKLKHLSSLTAMPRRSGQNAWVDTMMIDVSTYLITPIFVAHLDI